MPNKMEQTTFLDHYRLSQEDGSPIALERIGDLITYKAVDTRFHEPVTVKRLPVAKVDPAAREEFEKQARAARVLDHVNIARLLGFGIEQDHYVFVSEYLKGETVESWIAAHGPMPPEAVLRVALQVLSALRAASFHGLMHRAIQPSNLVIVPGETTEGGWPFVKLTNFGLAGMPLDSTRGSNPSMAARFASPEELQHGAVDFRSEIYSLGATMCFLLMSGDYSVESRLQHVRRLPTPIRNLLESMLHDDPEQRPQDQVVFEEAIRQCIEKVERRQALARRFGVPLAGVLQKHPDGGRALWPRRALILAALVLAMAWGLGMLLPADVVNSILHRNPEATAIGVPVGVPEKSATPLARPPSAAPEQIGRPAAQVAQMSPAASAIASPASTMTAPEQNGQKIAANEPATEPEPPTEGPDDDSSTQAAAPQNPPPTNSSVDAKLAEQVAPTENGKQAAPKAPAKTKSESSVAKRNSSKRSRLAQMPPEDFPRPRSRPRAGSFHARFLGTAPDGRWILGLPSGETTLVTPPSPRRIYLERRGVLLPPPQYGPVFPPED
jgi:hypothetical protein